MPGLPHGGPGIFASVDCAGYGRPQSEFHPQAARSVSGFLALRRHDAAMDGVPFRGSHAIASSAVTRHDLRTRYRRLYRDVYLARDSELTAAIRAHAAWLTTGATLAGLSAAAMLGTKWLDAGRPAEVIRSNRHPQRGIAVHSYSLAADEVCSLRDVQLTTPLRTAFDIGRTRPIGQAIPILDALFNATGIKSEQGPDIRGFPSVARTVDGD